MCEDLEGRVCRLVYGNWYNVKEMMYVKDLVSMGIGFVGFWCILYYVVKVSLVFMNINFIIGLLLFVVFFKF